MASGNYSTATGLETTASGTLSTAMGEYTTAQAYGSVVLGRFNVIAGGTESWNATDPVLVVGNGSSTSDRSDAMTLLENGSMTIAGTLTQNSDARLEKNVERLGHVLQRLEGVRGVSYEFKDQEHGPGGRHVGLIAQEVRDELSRTRAETDARLEQLEAALAKLASRSAKD